MFSMKMQPTQHPKPYVVLGDFKALLSDVFVTPVTVFVFVFLFFCYQVSLEKGFQFKFILLRTMNICTNSSSTYC